MSAEERKKAGIEGRKQRGEDIPDTDVRKEGSIFYVRSQTNTKDYTVRISQTPAACDCVIGAEDCPHNYSCNCEDRSKPCKHICKVHSMVQSSMAANSSANEGEYVFLI